MKSKKHINLILRSIAYLLLCVGFTLSIMEGELIWACSLAAGLFYESSALFSLILSVVNKQSS